MQNDYAIPKRTF